MLRPATIIAALLALAAAAPATASAPGPLVPAHAKVGGRSYAQWEVAWVKWRLALPIRAARSKTACITRDQHGPVWFLDGDGNQPKRLTRHCDVPAGLHLLLGPWIICTSIDPGAPEHTAAGLLRCAHRAFRAGFRGFDVTLDGKKLKPSSHRTTTDVFHFHVPSHDNMLGLSGRTHGRAAVRAATTLLAPLAAGKHTLKVTERYVGLTRRVTYRLTVG